MLKEEPFPGYICWIFPIFIIIQMLRAFFTHFVLYRLCALLEDKGLLTLPRRWEALCQPQVETRQVLTCPSPLCLSPVTVPLVSGFSSPFSFAEESAASLASDFNSTLEFSSSLYSSSPWKSILVNHGDEIWTVSFYFPFFWEAFSDNLLRVLEWKQALQVWQHTCTIQQLRDKKTTCSRSLQLIVSLRPHCATWDPASQKQNTWTGGIAQLIKCLPQKHEDLSLAPCTKPGMVVHTCNSRAEETQTGDSRGTAGQLTWLNW